VFDQAQVLNYLKIADIRIGLLINFNEILLKDGLKRLANKYNDNE
jgi:GxxExxY protein